MKTLTIILLLISATVYTQTSIRVTKTDSDSLWQDFKEFDRDITKTEYTVTYYDTDGMLVFYYSFAYPIDNFPPDVKKKINERLKR